MRGSVWGGGKVFRIGFGFVGRVFLDEEKLWYR